jgi:hypothetical protein
MRLSGTKTGAINQYRGLGNQLWDLAGNRPSLDLPFADNKSLVDATTGANLVDFTRQSNATYVDGDGVIRNAVTNLLLRSEEFDTTWGATRASVTANVIAAPNGTLTADKLAEDNITGTHFVTQALSYLNGVTYTFSVFAKASERDRIALRALTQTTWPGDARFDLSSGTIVSVSNGTAEILPIGDGWYRCSVTASALANASTGTGIFLVSADNVLSYLGDGTSGIYLWGAQLEQSTTVGEYIPTTSTINSAPRFDHDPTTGESLGLLVEEARTNEVRSSSMTGGATGTPGTYPTGLSTNRIATGLTLQIAALGTDAGVGYIDIRVSGTTADSNGFSINLQPAADAVASSGQTWTGSCYCSLVDGSYLNITAPRLRILERTAAGTYLAEGSGLVITATGTSILQARATVTRTLANASTARAQLGFVVGIASGVAVDFTFRFAAPQLEVGSFPTSYIPTTGATATRAADVASISGSNFSSWYRQDEGTVFADAVGVNNISGATRRYLEISDGTTSERTFLGYSGASNGRLFITDNGTTQADINVISTFSPKTAAGYVANGIQMAANGVLGTEDTSANLPTVDRLILGSQDSSTANTFLNGTIRRLTYWPQRLSDDTLQTITV